MAQAGGGWLGGPGEGGPRGAQGLGSTGRTLNSDLGHRDSEQRHQEAHAEAFLF